MRSPSKGLVSSIVNGKREISKAQAKKLGEIFNISASVFIWQMFGRMDDTNELSVVAFRAKNPQTGEPAAVIFIGITTDLLKLKHYSEVS